MKLKGSILAVDDDASIIEFLDLLLTKSGYQVTTTLDPSKAWELYQKHSFDLVLTDLQMPQMSGMELLSMIRNHTPDAAVMILTAHGSTDNAVQAMKMGAFDYITKPCSNDELILRVQKALENRVLKAENRTLRKDVMASYDFHQIMGTSQAITQVYEMVKKVANNQSNVLILGESGTGKELVARALHYNSSLKEKPFVCLNCGAIPISLMESEMFGHKKGSFTGAITDKEGLFYTADGGTIFLDEVGDLPGEIQVKLLRVIQNRKIRPVGSVDDIAIDIRIIAATNRDLEQMVKKGQFREDLFYRLNVIQIRTPPLRSRREDIAVLSKFFLTKAVTKSKKSIGGITEEALRMLSNYDFPGNVRELENAIERAVAVESSALIQPESLPPFITQNSSPDILRKRVAEITLPPTGIDLDKTIEAIELSYLTKAIQVAGSSPKKAADLLGLTARSFRYRLQKHNLEHESDEDL